MDDRMKEFLRLFDVAIAEASEMQRELQVARADQGLVDEATLTLENLRGYKDSAASGKLGPSGGAGMGMSRAVGEWASGTPLMEAVRTLERYYQTQM
jgi:aspartyl/asparaginyl-tRNA synthetase